MVRRRCFEWDGGYAMLEGWLLCLGKGWGMGKEGGAIDGDVGVASIDI
jgi:hypothetical protein